MFEISGVFQAIEISCTNCYQNITELLKYQLKFYQDFNKKISFTKIFPKLTKFYEK